jgi:hypothetical protein
MVVDWKDPGEVNELSDFDLLQGYENGSRGIAKVGRYISDPGGSYRDYQSLRSDFRKNHTMYWGKVYRSAEIVPNWSMPSAEDINMAFEVIAIADKSAMKIGNLIESPSFGDKVWTNDFCRSAHVVDRILRGSYNLFMEDSETKTGGKTADT